MDALVLVAAAAEEPDYSGLLKPVPGLMVWTLVVFLVVLFILKRYAFGPLANLIEQRREEVRKNLADAEEARNEAHQTLDDYRKQLASARIEAAEIVEKTRKNAEEQRAKMQAELAEERERGIAAAQQAIQAETRQSLDRIKQEIADLAMLTTSKALNRALDEGEQRRLIDEALADVDLSKLEQGGR